MYTYLGIIVTKLQIIIELKPYFLKIIGILRDYSQNFG